MDRNVMDKNVLIGVLCCAVVGLAVYIMTKKPDSGNNQTVIATKPVDKQIDVSPKPTATETTKKEVVIVPTATAEPTIEAKPTLVKSQADALSTFYQFFERYMMTIRDRDSLDKDAKPLDDASRAALIDWFSKVSFEQMDAEQKVDCERLRKNLIAYLGISKNRSSTTGAKLADITQMMWPALVDFKLTAAKATSDGHAKLADFVNGHYRLARTILLLKDKIDLEKAQGSPAVKLFGEYFILYVYIAAVDKRYEATPGQAALLGMHPEILTDQKERELLQDVHNSMLNLSNTLNAGGSTAMAQGRAMVAIINVMQKLKITPEALGKASDPSYAELAEKMLELVK